MQRTRGRIRIPGFTVVVRKDQTFAPAGAEERFPEVPRERYMTDSLAFRRAHFMAYPRALDWQVPLFLDTSFLSFMRRLWSTFGVC